MESRLIDESKVQFREYQVRIAESVKKDGNSLVILPTGLGKTIVALLVIEDKLRKGKRTLFLAPTRPLAEQHQKSLSSLLKIPPERIVLFTGSTPAEKRAALWKDAFIVCATPQTIENDLKNERVSLSSFGLCVIDECHRSVKKYSYTYVAEACKGKGIQLLGLTASPGGKKERIEEVSNALGITNIEIRTETDEDVLPYVKKIDAKFVEVELPEEMLKIRDSLEKILVERMAPLRNSHLIPSTSPHLPKRFVLDAGKKLFAMPDTTPSKFALLSHYATVMNLMHIIELIETQGLSAFLSYISKLEARDEKSKAVKRILEDPRVAQLITHAIRAQENGDHPKLAKLVEVVNERKGKRIIVFVQYRDQITKVVGELVKNNVSARQFVGKREGVKLKDQKAAIADFRSGKFDVMVASSIGEEGLDIPSVDTVVFYEPVPSEIRLIQRRGRAGRSKSGEVVFLITKDTRDEAYHYSSRSREAKMKKIVKSMQSDFNSTRKARGAGSPNKPQMQKQSTMNEFLDEQVSE